MPENARRRRAPARQRGQEAARRGYEPARRGREPARGQEAARRGNTAARQSRPPRPNRPPQADPYTGLDRALAAAAAAPAPAAATFSQLGLPERLVRALAARDIHEPFAIQARALPDTLAGRDVLGRAQTGSGKTLAFGLPMLTRLAATNATDGTAAASPRRRERAPRGLVLVPTRELAQQVADVLAPLGRAVGVSVMTVYGGVPIGRQITRIRDGVDIVVATPGRLIDLLDRQACTLASIEITVLDEADHMADLGFLPAVTRILDETPAGGQRMLFSATLDRRVGQLVTSYLSDPALHAVTPEALAGGTAEHRVLVLEAQDKVPVATEIASRPARTLFFVRTKHGADRLAKQLSRAGVEAAAIHGNRNQSQRQRALDAFAAGHPRVLVATDVAARGIHVDDIELVVHFDPPNDHKDYLHRSGRTARAGASGMVVTLAEQGQIRELQRMHDAAGVSAARHHVDVGHHVVREIATSGTPVPPAPAAPPGSTADGAARRRPRAARHGGGQPRGAQPQRAGATAGRASRRPRNTAGQSWRGESSAGAARE
ncbi:MAG TPA: DEAD/DEAH box helicase [Streptosporangiaceae bacterium]|nr:DEAD/DEAH box helicase [Streptosporangiaceae bacterium]